MLAEDCDFICRDPRGGHTYAVQATAGALLTLQRCAQGGWTYEGGRDAHVRLSCVEPHAIAKGIGGSLGTGIIMR